jgi:enamine deaminase RidA (YjgF/YER057c/UK114 family)
VRADNLVFLRGQIGMNLDANESVGIGDPVAQTERAMSNIEMLLGEAEARLEDICKFVVYLTDVRYRDPVYQVIRRWLRGIYPCLTGVVVTGLARREWVVEIDATAVIRAIASPARKALGAARYGAIGAPVGNRADSVV